jgi:hypothetical protein
MSENKESDAGSRMHVLDWLESPQFLPVLRSMVAPIGFTVEDDAQRMPKGRHAPRESELVGRKEPFLSAERQVEIANWWLVHKVGAKMPTWDLAISAFDATGYGALILVEAKAHATELSSSGKKPPNRKKQDQQERSDSNHAQIADAIAKANAALQVGVPGILLSRDANYQFSNRIAFAWKLASLGIPTALIYLGFIGDEAISFGAHCLRTPSDWQAAFEAHSAKIFPINQLGQRIDCGAASFWVLVRHLPVLRQSPPIEQRRILE